MGKRTGKEEIKWKKNKKERDKTEGDIKMEREHKGNDKMGKKTGEEVIRWEENRKEVIRWEREPEMKG